MVTLIHIWDIFVVINGGFKILP